LSDAGFISEYENLNFLVCKLRSVFVINNNGKNLI
jgi:hypothetical protein